MSEFMQTVEAEVLVVVDDFLTHDAISRVTGPDGDAWRSTFYDLYTEADVIDHWAYNAIANSVEDACRLDGWADLPRGAVKITIVETRAI